MKDSQKLQKKKRFFSKNKTKPVKLKPSGVVFRAKNPYRVKLNLFLIPLILLSLYLTLYLSNLRILQNIQRNNTISATDTTLSPYPVVLNEYTPYLTAKAAIILEQNSQTVIFAKNPLLRFSMASTAKIMTAITALDYFKKESILVIKTGHVEGSGLNLQVGDRFYFEDLLYAMLLPSANDAALAIAENYPGGSTTFVSKMNEKAKKLHLTDTHFEDPIGLDDDHNFTTVVDLSRLGSEIIKNKELAQVVSTQQKLINNVDHTQEYYIFNLNKLLGTQGVNGIKTGTTEGAGEVLLTSTELNGHTYIIVVMNSQNRFVDTQTLIAFLYQNVQFNLPSF